MECGRGVVMSMSSLSRSNTISRSATLNKNHRTRTKDVLVTQRHGSGGVESILLVGKSNNRWTIRKMLRRLCKSHGFKNLQVRKFFLFFFELDMWSPFFPKSHVSRTPSFQKKKGRNFKENIIISSAPSPGWILEKEIFYNILKLSYSYFAGTTGREALPTTPPKSSSPKPPRRWNVICPPHPWWRHMRY